VRKTIAQQYRARFDTFMLPEMRHTEFQPHSGRHPMWDAGTHRESVLKKKTGDQLCNTHNQLRQNNGGTKIEQHQQQGVSRL
jgi:hypothetical protein